MSISNENEKLQLTISRKLGKILEQEGKKLGLRKSQMASKIILEKYERELINMEEKQ
jgi:hypothetical protein